MMRTRLLVVLGILIAGLIVAAPPAQAITFNFTSDHCTGGCGTPPFGTVTLTQNGTTVDVTVHLNPPNEFVKTGSADFMAFKFNATGVVLGDITVDQTVTGQTLIAATGNFSGDGTGFFAFGIQCSTCANGATDSFDDDIVFHVANATIDDLDNANELGNIFVADIISQTSGGGTGNTGPVDVTGTPVLEPSTLLLLGGSLVGLGFVRRLAARRRP